VSIYQLTIITPEGRTYTGEVVHARIPAEDGYVGVLACHAPYVTSSPGGAVEIEEKDGAKMKFEVGPGFFTVENNRADFFTQSFSTH